MTSETEHEANLFVVLVGDILSRNSSKYRIELFNGCRHVNIFKDRLTGIEWEMILLHGIF